MLNALALLFLLPAPAAAGAQDFDRGGFPSIPALVEDLSSGNKVLAPKPTAQSTIPVSGEISSFWENLMRDASDGLCQAAELQINEQGRLDSGPGIGGDFKRYLRKDPRGKLFIIDEIGVNLSVALGTQLVQLPELGPLNIGFSGSVAGRSVVVQPLGTDRYCRELGTLVQLYKVKAALPASASRIALMKPGEIWKLPLSLRIAFSAGAAAPLNTFLVAYVSAGASRESRPSVTLRRLDEGSLRLRVRLEKVDVFATGASVATVSIPVEAIGLPLGENFLSQAVNRAWAREVNKYLAASIFVNHSRYSGKKLLLEFVLNPRDEDQMEALEKFLQGDFGMFKRFIELGARLDDVAQDDDLPGGHAAISGAAAAAGQALGSQPTFAGGNANSGYASEFGVTIPVAHSHTGGRRTAYNRYQSLDDGGAILHVREEARYSHSASLDIPFYGKYYKLDSEQSVLVTNTQRADGTVSSPGLIYQETTGFVRQTNETGRRALERFNEILRYVGVRGYGDNAWNTLQTEQVFPVLPGDHNATGDFPGSKICHSAIMSFRILINEGGLRKILAAPVRELMRAYLNIACDVSGAGRKMLGDDWGLDDDDGGPMALACGAARDAQKFLQDIASIKNAGGWRAQAERLSKVASGASKSGLSYEKFMQVVVQLLDPADLAAELFVHTDKRQSGEKDVTKTYRFFSAREGTIDRAMGGAAGMRDRFAEPSVLSD